MQKGGPQGARRGMTYIYAYNDLSHLKTDRDYCLTPFQEGVGNKPAKDSYALRSCMLSGGSWQEGVHMHNVCM